MAYGKRNERREARRIQAEARRLEREARTIEEQLRILDSRPGQSERERARLGENK